MVRRLDSILRHASSLCYCKEAEDNCNERTHELHREKGERASKSNSATPFYALTDLPAVVLQHLKNAYVLQLRRH